MISDLRESASEAKAIRQPCDPVPPRAKARLKVTLTKG